MEDNKDYEQQFAKGFNEGYLLSKFSPTLARQLADTSLPDGAYFDGMKSGKLTHERDLFAENLQRSKAMGQQRRKGPRMG